MPFFRRRNEGSLKKWLIPARGQVSYSGSLEKARRCEVQQNSLIPVCYDLVDAGLVEPGGVRWSTKACKGNLK